MIFEWFFGIFSWFIEKLIGLLGVFTLPLDLVTVLADITCYGAWIVGDDLLLIVAGCISFWLMIKFTAGLLVFIWKLLPFT